MLTDLLTAEDIIRHQINQFFFKFLKKKNLMLSPVFHFITGINRKQPLQSIACLFPQRALPQAYITYGDETGNWAPFHTVFSSKLQFLLLNKMKAKMLNYCCQKIAFSKSEMPIVLQIFCFSFAIFYWSL